MQSTVLISESLESVPDDEQDDILKYPAMKAPFTDGRTVDLSLIKTQHKQINLSLWMLAGSVEEFMNNYQAFFNQLTGAGTQDLYIIHWQEVHRSIIQTALALR